MPSTESVSRRSAQRAGDAAVLDQERAVAGDRGDQRLLRAHHVRVPEPRHVDAALDRRAQLVLVGGAAARQHEVGRARARGLAAGRERVAGGLRRPASAALRMSWTTRVRHAVLDQRQRAPWACPRRRRRAAACAGSAGESERLIARRGHPRRRAGRRARRGPRRAARPLRRSHAEQVEQPADGVRLDDHRVLARRELRPARRRPRPCAPPARASVRGVELGRRDRGASRVAAAPARGDADHLHEGVGHALRDAAGDAGAGRDRRFCLGGGPDAVGLARRAAGATAKAASRARAAARRVELGGLGVVAGVRARRAPARGSPGRRPAPPAVARRASAAARRPRARRRASRRRSRRSSRPADVPVADTVISTVTSSMAVACVGRERAKRSSSERSRVTGAPSAVRGRGDAAQRALAPASPDGSRHADLRRRGSAPAPSRARRASPGPARPCRSRAATRAATRPRADGVAARPELGRDARVARVAQQPAALAALDLPRGLALELEVEPAGVDRPRAVGLDQDPARRVRRSGPRACRRRRARGSRWSSARSAGARSRSARMQPPERSSPISAAVSREERKPASTPSRTIGTRRGPPRPRRPSRRCRGRRAWWRRRSRSRAASRSASDADAVGREEARAGVGGLAPEHAVELDGVADRLVHLEARAARRQDQRGAPGRAGGRRQQGDGLLGHARRVADQVERRGSARSRPPATSPPCEAG